MQVLHEKKFKFLGRKIDIPDRNCLNMQLLHSKVGNWPFKDRNMITLEKSHCSWIGTHIFLGFKKAFIPGYESSIFGKVAPF